MLFVFSQFSEASKIDKLYFIRICVNLLVKRPRPPQIGRLVTLSTLCPQTHSSHVL